jgi:Sarcosine oxidase A3 domain
VVGAVSGTFDLEGAITEGTRAGALAASADAKTSSAPPVTEPVPKSRAQSSSAVPRKTSGKAFVDLQNDVTVDDIHLARSEGYASAEHLKRYTTLGMGTDQGKTSNVNALSLMADLAEVSVAGIGTTTFRPPYTPVTIGAFGGPRGRPPFPPDSTDADARLARPEWRQDDRGRPLEEAVVLPFRRCKRR